MIMFEVVLDKEEVGGSNGKRARESHEDSNATKFINSLQNPSLEDKEDHGR